MAAIHRSRVVGFALAVLAVAVLSVGAWWFARGVGGTASLAQHLRNRGRVARLGASDLGRLDGHGTDLIPLSSLPGLREALAGESEAGLARAMDEADLAGLLVDGRRRTPLAQAGSLLERLYAYGHVSTLQGIYLAPAAAYYERRTVIQAEPPLDEALAAVARGILVGKRPPRVSSFPGPLRSIRSVEVMVMLEEAGRPRLWRSARGSSIARALITAAVVARERWQERQSAMGGPIEEELPRMTVEVSLLLEDGTVGARHPAFLDRAITPHHGVGYERKGSWRYLLPNSSRDAGGGSEAFRSLLEDNGLEPEAIDRPDMRLYRLVVEPLARSRPDREGAAR